MFAELEDDEEIVEDDDIPDDDENEDEQEYEEVMVSRNLLTMVRRTSIINLCKKLIKFGTDSL